MLMQTLGGSGDGSSPWVPATLGRAFDWVPGSDLIPPDFAGIRGVNCQAETLCFFDSQIKN